jgi:DNA-binding transcriptional regulator YiaG
MTTSPIPPTPEAILAARKAAGLSQAQAAAVVHRPSYRTWQDWERGRAKMPLDAWELFMIKTGQWKSSLA